MIPAIRFFVVEVAAVHGWRSSWWSAGHERIVRAELLSPYQLVSGGIEENDGDGNDLHCFDLQLIDDFRLYEAIVLFWYRKSLVGGGKERSVAGFAYLVLSVLIDIVLSGWESMARHDWRKRE
jgi:hypothetical protein